MTLLSSLLSTGVNDSSVCVCVALHLLLKKTGLLVIKYIVTG